MFRDTFDDHTQLPLKTLAPVKLNLMLRILGRRADGYHRLQTLFEVLDWGDEMQFMPQGASSGWSMKKNQPPVSIDGDFGSLPTRDNLIWRAAAKLWPQARRRRSVHVRTVKRIPTGGGLGGGSSNAAVTLRVLNRYWKCGLTSCELARVGLELGADVPFFVHQKPALASGVGERLKPVFLPVRHYVLVFPTQGLSTADVFAHPLLPRNSQTLPVAQAVQPPNWQNDCLPVAQSLCPPLARSWQAVEKTLADFSSPGTYGPHLSGTGSTFFVAFDQAGAAYDFARVLACLGPENFPARIQVAASRRLVKEKE